MHEVRNVSREVSHSPAHDFRAPAGAGMSPIATTEFADNTAAVVRAFCSRPRRDKPSNSLGWVAEWFKAAVLKTANPQGFVGSNPTPSEKPSSTLYGCTASRRGPRWTVATARSVSMSCQSMIGSARSDHALMRRLGLARERDELVVGDRLRKHLLNPDFRRRSRNRWRQARRNEHYRDRVPTSA